MRSGLGVDKRTTKINKLPKRVLLVCVCLFALTGQAIADSLSDAKRAYDAGNYAKAAKLFRLLAQRGNAEAQTSLGLMYAGGQGVPQDYIEAVKWYQLAAEQSNPIAQESLGGMYANGQGVPQDYTEAVKWFRLAAEQGDTFAQFILGLMYEQGKGVPQDYVLAHMWTNIAAANEDSAGGRDDAIEQRDSIATHMTARQIAEAQQLARKCTAKKFKGC